MNWSPFQITFLLDGVAFYTYNPAVKTPSNWPFNAEQYLLLNIAMGGVAGNIPSNFNQATMEIDYVRVYQNTVVDTQAPTNFTASIGAVTSSTIELLLNANDNSGNVNYNITYSGGTIGVANPSGIQKSVVVPNLLPNTNYSFSVSCSDLAGNNFVANPILLNATTTGVIGCSGTDTQAQQGSFSIGYNYAFETIGTDVKITFEMLDVDKVGVVGILWRQSPFTEYQMSNVSGNIFTKTITGQTIGSTINYAVKFAYAGGLSVTRYFSYVVGNNCTLDVPTLSEPRQLCYPNPVENTLHLQLLDDNNLIFLTDVLGKTQLEMEVSANEDIDMSNFKPGIYFLRIQNSRGIQNFKIIKN
jgi:hypothetical protein